jgi:hypothetical protein
MKNATILAIAAVPGALLGYALLTGYLLARIRPLPISWLPEPGAALPQDAGEALAA